ncbi:hypothetical protein B0J12DRAFT_565143, partial [Macrophomina phaseolina]
VVSVFHQIHCLYSILSDYLDLRSGKQLGGEKEYSLQCFNYLRQSLQCCGDTALEGSDIYAAAEGRNGTLGIGSTHVCRDYEAILHFVESSPQLL